jgi:hypothetical protein
VGPQFVNMGPQVVNVGPELQFRPRRRPVSAGTEVPALHRRPSSTSTSRLHIQSGCLNVEPELQFRPHAQSLVRRSSEVLDDGAHLLDRIVDLFLGRETTKAEADGREREVVLDTAGFQHV